MCESAYRREQAIDFLQRRTDALRDVIERFVDLDWDPEASDDENLERFSVYLAELSETFTY